MNFAKANWTLDRFYKPTSYSIINNFNQNTDNQLRMIAESISLPGSPTIIEGHKANLVTEHLQPANNTVTQPEKKSSQLPPILKRTLIFEEKI